MNKIRKLLLICMTIVMCATTLNTKLFADATTYTITINNDKENHKYTAYQIFAGDVYVDGTTTYLSNVKWGENIDYVALLSDLKNDANLSAHFSKYSTVDAAGIASEFFDTNMYQRLASHISKHVTGTGHTSTKSGSTYTISGLNPGYYLVIDEATGILTTNDTLSRNILEVVKNVTVTPKSQGIPTISKSVVESNDSTHEIPNYLNYNFSVGADNQSTQTWKYLSALAKSNVADHDIGDDVVYSLNITLPSDGHTLPTSTNKFNVAYATSNYRVVVEDTISKGLTLDENSIRVFVGNGDKDAYREVTSALNATNVKGHYDNTYKATTTNTGYPILAGAASGEAVKFGTENLYYVNGETDKVTTTSQTNQLFAGGTGNQVTLNGDKLYYEYVLHTNSGGGVGASFNEGDSRNTYVTSKIEKTVQANTDSTTTLKLDIANILADNIGAKDGEHIWVFYKCELNSDAVIGGTGNENTVKMKYSNSPSSDSLGETTPDKAVVYTYEIDFHKVTGTTSTPLDGADFKLEKLYQSYPITLDTDGKVTGVGKFAYYDSVKKTIAFDDTNTKSDIGTLITAAASYQEVYVELTNKVTSGDGTTTKSVFKYKGLDEGTYRLTEIKTPDGYNSIDPVVFNLNSNLNELDSTLIEISLVTINSSIDLAVNSTTGTLSPKILNKRGVVLPTTGGIGTTIFYVVGSIMVIGAVVALIVKKRVDIKD